MKHSIIRMINLFIRIALFMLALGLVVIFVIQIDAFVGTQRLYFLRTGNWEDLITVSILGILLAYVLKRLLVLQFHWGFKK